MVLIVTDLWIGLAITMAFLAVVVARSLALQRKAGISPREASRRYAVVGVRHEGIAAELLALPFRLARGLVSDTPRRALKAAVAPVREAHGSYRAALLSLSSEEFVDEPKQTTPAGQEIPIPKREDFDRVDRMVKKVAPPPVGRKRPDETDEPPERSE
jgi:hypothetical protein